MFLFGHANIEHFKVRNAGNLIPHSKLYGIDSATTEPAALELGCIVNNVKHMIVCGHSDCKVRSGSFHIKLTFFCLNMSVRITIIYLQAMNLLYSFKKGIETNMKTLEKSPLKAWLHRHGTISLTKFERLEENGFETPLTFPMEGPFRQFVAYIDPDNKFNLTDKLSQVNIAAKNFYESDNTIKFYFTAQHFATTSTYC